MDAKIALVVTKDGKKKETSSSVSLKHKNWAKVEFVLAQERWTVKIGYHNGTKAKFVIAKESSKICVWRNGVEQSLTPLDAAFEPVVDQIVSTDLRIQSAFVNINMEESTGVMKVWPALHGTAESVEQIQIHFVLGC